MWRSRGREFCALNSISRSLMFAPGIVTRMGGDGIAGSVDPACGGGDRARRARDRRRGRGAQSAFDKLPEPKKNCPAQTDQAVSASATSKMSVTPVPGGGRERDTSVPFKCPEPIGQPFLVGGRQRIEPSLHLVTMMIERRTPLLVGLGEEPRERELSGHDALL